MSTPSIGYGGTVVLDQEADSCQPEKKDQRLEIGLEDAGGGIFLVLRTSRWAVDDPDEFCALLRRIMAIEKPT